MDMCVLGIWGSRYTAGGYGYRWEGDWRMCELWVLISACVPFMYTMHIHLTYSGKKHY